LERMTEQEKAKYWEDRAEKLESTILALADHFGLGLFYECNKPGVFGWWWEYGKRGTPERRTMEGNYIDDLPEAVENYFGAVGFKGQYYGKDEK
jgi:hypothetical protein